MRVVSLFSGGGLGDLGFLMAGCEIVAQVEIDEYCQKILALRYPDAKKFKDIRTVKGSDLPPCDIITGGFPCQPFSVAGKQQGVNDNRHLWPEMFRIISEVRPTWVVGENVSGFIKLGLDLVLNDLESIGYEATTIVFPAHALGAPHRRERVWIVGYAKYDGPSGTKERRPMHEPQEQTEQVKSVEPSGTGTVSEDVANSNNSRRIKQCGASTVQKKQSSVKCSSIGYRKFWEVESCVGRVANGVPNRVDRLKLLGNGQVPAATLWIASNIIQYERELNENRLQ